MVLMNARKVGIIIAFSALTIVLTFVRIPVPYPPGFSYQVFEIPIVVAFLLFGFKYGIVVALINMVAAMTFLIGPGGLLGPPFYFAAILWMLVGVQISLKIVSRWSDSIKAVSASKYVALSTAVGILTRTIFMLPLDWALYGAIVSLVTGISVP